MKNRILLCILLAGLTLNQTFGQCDSISLIGEFSGWAGDLFMTQDLNNPDRFVTLVTFSEENDPGMDGIIEVKFRRNASWEINWGSSDFPSGAGVQNGSNIPVPYGKYSVIFNCMTGEYTFYLFCGLIGLMGEFNGWTDEMTLVKDQDSSQINRLSIIFSEEHDLYPDGLVEVKFRENGTWDRNWGGVGFPADTLVPNGPNLPVPYGIYIVIFNCATMEYTFINTAAINENEMVTHIAIMPNPFQTNVRISYELEHPAEVTLVILNSTGQQVKQFADEWQTVGIHQFNWNAEGCPEGMYFYRLSVAENTTSGKLVLR